MGEAAVAFDLKRLAPYGAPNLGKRCKVAEVREADSFSTREILESPSKRATTHASSSIRSSTSGQHDHDDQLRDVLALLKDSEQNIRKMRGVRADSEAFSSKCRTLLQDISKLRDLASAGCFLKQVPGRGHGGASQAHPLCAQERLADVGWFRDVGSAIDAAIEVVSKCKAELAGIQVHAHDETGMHGERAAKGVGDIQEGDHSRDLVAAVQRIAAVREIAAALKQVTEALQGPAHEAGGWACAAFRKLTKDLCAHDDALVAMREHAAKQFEAHGKAAISQGNALLQEEDGRGASEAFAWILQAKAAYDEIYGLRPFGGQRAPELPYPDFSKESEKSENMNKEDKVAVVSRLRDLAQEQLALQAKLHGIQLEISGNTRRLMADQRCCDVWQLVDDLWINSQDGRNDSQQVQALVQSNGTGKKEQAPRRGKVSKQDEAALQAIGSAEESDASVNKLQIWVSNAAEQLHVASLIRITEMLEQQLKQLGPEREQELHFLRELQALSGGKQGKKNIHSSLDDQLKQFYADELTSIARKRASCAEVCSCIKFCLGQYDVEGDEVDDAQDQGGKGAADVLKSRGREASPQKGRSKEKEKDKVPEKERGRARGKRGGTSGAVAEAGAGRVNANINTVQGARRALFSLVCKAKDIIRENGGIGATIEVSKALKAHMEKCHKDVQPAPCSTTMVVIPSLTSRASGLDGRRGAMLRDDDTTPVLVSGRAASAWEACVEYVYGIKRLLDRSEHFMLSGDVLGNMEIGTVADLGHAMDSDSSDCDSLVRIVLSGLGAVDASFRKSTIESEIPPSEQGGRGIELFVRNCKGLCRTIDLVLQRKVANALVLLGPFNEVVRIQAMDSGSNFCKGAIYGDDSEAKTAKKEVSETEVMLRCLRSHLCLQHPWLRRMALVNLAGNCSFENFPKSDDLLLLNACPRAVPVQVLEHEGAEKGAGASSQNVRTCAEANASISVHEGRHAHGSDSKDEMHLQTRTRKPDTSVESNDKKSVGKTQLILQQSIDAGHDKLCDRGNLGSGSHIDTNLESSSRIPTTTRSDSIVVDQKESVGDSIAGASPWTSSMEISASLREYQPELILVFYDKDSRLATGDEGQNTNQDQREQIASKNLLLRAVSIVKDAAEICNGNLVFLEAGGSPPLSADTKVDGWLASVRATTCILESALRVPKGLEDGGGQMHPESASYLPWPMPFNGDGAANGPIDQRVPLASHDSSTEKLNFKLDEISFETLGGTPLAQSETAKRISRQDDSRKDAASAHERQEDVGKAGSENVLPGPQRSDVGGSSSTGMEGGEGESSTLMEIEEISVDGGARDRNKESGMSDSLADVEKSISSDEGHDATRAKKRVREHKHMPSWEGKMPSEAPVMSGKQLRAVKPHDAAIEVLRGKPEGLTLDEIVESCQRLPRKLDIGSSRPGTQGMDARGALRHALTAGCSSSGGHLHRRTAAFIKCGDRYQLLHEVSRDTLARAAVLKAALPRYSDDKQTAKCAVSTVITNDSEKHEAAKDRMRTGRSGLGLEASLGLEGRNPGEGSAAGDSDHVEGHVEGQSDSIDGKISDKLLDLADRIPYNSVHESTAAVWENFRVKTENCTTPAELSQQLVWFSKQILPRVLRSSWEQQSSAGCKSSALDLWRDRCGQCKDEADVMELLKDFECNAIDWDKVSAAFREEWKASKSRFRSSKHKRIQLSRAEELALAATTQVPHCI